MAETKRSRVFFDINIGKTSAGRVTFELVPSFTASGWGRMKLTWITVQRRRSQDCRELPRIVYW